MMWLRHTASKEIVPLLLFVIALMVLIGVLFLYKDPQDRVASATIVMAAFTAFYAMMVAMQTIATRKLAEQAEKQRRDSVKPVLVVQGPGFMDHISDPYISINQTNPSRLTVKISNVGKGPALDARASGADAVPILGEGKSCSVHLNFDGKDLTAIPEMHLEITYVDLFGNGMQTIHTLKHCKIAEDTKYVVSATVVKVLDTPGRSEK